LRQSAEFGELVIMLRIVLLVVAFLGLSSSAFAAQPSLFDGFLKKNNSHASASMMSPKTVSGPISITVDISTQSMRVASEGGRTIYTFDVSTGRPGYGTPTGNFRPIRMHKMWYSAKYENAPMPYSIFFHGGYAIHGTTDLKHLGQVASHGCVRLDPANAEKLFNLVNQVGMNNTKVVLIRS
jgi:lipoprotein-anchoring transpeptidase ErfK/SrfK